MKFSRKHLSIPYGLFLTVFVILPLLLIVYYAFTNKTGQLTFNNFVQFFTSAESLSALVYSLYVAFITTAASLVIGYPVAYFLSNPNFNKNKVIIVLFILPMWMNFLLRTLAIKEMFLMIGLRLGELTTIIGMVYDFLPFMILPIYTQLLKMDKSLLEAAADLGASPSKVFAKVIVPQSMPGVFSGALMVFMPTISTFVISDLLSGGNIQLLGNLINIYFTTGSNWNVGAAISLILIILIGATMLFTNGKSSSEGKGGLW